MYTTCTLDPHCIQQHRECLQLKHGINSTHPPPTNTYICAGGNKFQVVAINLEHTENLNSIRQLNHT